MKRVTEQSNLLLKVSGLREAIQNLSALENISKLDNELHTIENSSSYHEAKKKSETILFYEGKKKEEFAGSFENKELVWWKSQIDRLNTDKKNISNRRILGYISLAAWTYSSKSIDAGNLPLAAKSLEIYKMADPENAEQPFLKAKFCAAINQTDSAIYFLGESVKLGFRDKSKIENEPGFINLRSRDDYRQIVSAIN
jgi:hypothetical protein